MAGGGKIKYMEKLPHQEYRDELADKLKEIRNSDPENPEVAKAKAEGYLEAKKETREYEKSKELHSEDMKVLSFLEKNNKERERFISEVKDELEKVKKDTSLGYVFKELKLTIVEPYETDGPGGLTQKRFDLKISENPYFGISIEGNLSSEDVANLLENQNKIPKIFQKFRIECGSKTYLMFNENEESWQKFGYPLIISSLRFKEELQPIENTIEKVNKLRGVSFKWKSNEDSPREIGVIAEEVAEVFPELVFLDEKGKPLGVHYDKFVAVLIEAVKDLDKRVKELEK